MAERLKTTEKSSLPLAINEVFDMVRAVIQSVRILSDPKLRFLDAHPTGSIYLTTSADENTAAKMASKYGGTWVAWSAGRVPVGYQTSDADFNVVEKTGGRKTVGNHYHWTSTSFDGNSLYVSTTGQVSANSRVRTANRANYVGGTIGTATTREDATSYQEGSGSAENLPPYITCYMWKRTA